jgi:FkbM family methyltransferase
MSRVQEESITVELAESRRAGAPMPMSISRLRKPVDTFAPRLGTIYRRLRDLRIARRSIPTRYGFTLAGAPAMAREHWEEEEIGEFLALLETHDAVLDIGANVGFYSCLAASRGKPTLVFEPSERNLRLLTRNLWENGLKSVEVFPVGLAGESGLRRMYGFGGIASFVPGWAQARPGHFSLAPLATLDKIVAGRFPGQKLLIKVDVEGFELDVLRGAEETLSRSPRPVWMVEILLRDGVIPGGVSSHFSEAFEVFRRHGYGARKLDAARTPVEPSGVSRWVAQGFVDGGTHDFLFSGD